MNLFGKWIRNFRFEKEMTGKQMGDRLGVSQVFIVKLESGEKNPSEELLKRLFVEFNIPENEKNKIIELVALDKSPELIKKNYIKFVGLKIEGIKTHELLVYKLNTSGDGVLREKYTEVFVMPEKLELTNGAFAIEIIDNVLKPKIIDGDKVLVQKLEFKSWKKLNDKIVVVRYDDEKIVRYLKFQDGKPILVSFTGFERNIMIDDTIEYLGIVTNLINREI